MFFYRGVRIPMRLNSATNTNIITTTDLHTPTLTRPGSNTVMNIRMTIGASRKSNG